MTTPMVTLSHPDRKDLLVVSTAAARVHKRAGWVEASASEQIPAKAADRITWIGTDPERAELARTDEQSRTNPRQSVLDHIETVINPVTPDESQED